MEINKGYRIHHLQLKDCNGIQPMPGDHYLVFWCDQVPLGHWWAEAGKEGLTPDAMKEQLLKVIQQPLRYYSGNNAQTIKNAASLIRQGSFDQLHELVKTVITNQYNSHRYPANEQQTLSIIVCTRNRPAALMQCLTGLTAANKNDRAEIIVIDNASDDEQTREVVEKFIQVKYVYEGRKGLDIARNRGIREASGSIIAFTDDDVYVPEGWIHRLKQAFSDPMTMAVTGLILPGELETAAQISFEKEHSFNKGFCPKVFDRSYFLRHLHRGVPAWEIGAGANMAFRKEAFFIAGLFDERLDVGASGCSGDSEMWYRILAEGFNCFYDPSLYVCHFHRRTGEGLRSQLFHYMRGHVSALLVQYENYAHKGNLTRLRKSLPAYYLRQIRYNLVRFRLNRLRELLNEIRGCFSGARFYRANRHRKRTDIFSWPYALRKTDDGSKVSVIIPCYNYGRFLATAVNSVLKQTWKDHEIIIVDDGSDDDTPEVAASFGEKVKYIRTGRAGVSAARNIGIQFSGGNFIVFLDADDWLYENALEDGLFFCKQYPDAAVVSGDFDKVTETAGNIRYLNEPQGDGEGYLSLLQGNYIGMPATAMYRRELFPYFSFRGSLNTCEDYDLNLRIARYLPVIRHHKKVAAYRIHQSNTSANKQRMLSSALKVLKTLDSAQNTPEEKQAILSGMQNWTQYYNH